MSKQPTCPICGKKVWKMVTSYDNQGKFEVDIKDVCDCNPVLIPYFSCGEPNLASTRKKNEEIAMEDVRDISLEALEFIKAKLKEFDITLTDAEDDALYVPMTATIEKIAKYPDYHSHN